jgi:hypothetical protein
MRYPARAALTLIALAVAACSASERNDLSPTGVVRFQMNDPSRVDTVGTADLVVDYGSTARNWVVRDENIGANFCSAIEGGVEPGLRRLLRFTVTTPNLGDADVFVGSPRDHMDPNGDGDFADQDGMFEFASCHGHFHFQHYAEYRLIDPATGKLWRAAKAGFCMLDTDPWNTNSGDGGKNYYNCGNLTIDGFQGISDGFADTYMFFLGGQYFVLDGGDGQAPVPPGRYIIQVEVNPAYAAPRRGGCPLVTDPATGLCHQFEESNYANNTTSIPVVIPEHPGRTGYGPLKGSEDSSYEKDKAH